MSFSYPSSTRLLLCIQSTSSRTPECFCFHSWNSSHAEWRCTPDRRRLYGMLWGKPPAEWCSSARFGSHVSLFPMPIFGLNTVALHRCWLITVEIYTYVMEIDLDGDLDAVVEILMETDVVKDLEFWNGPDESLSDRHFDILHKHRHRQITMQPRNTSLQ
jgi:hypothetical protein